MNKLDIDSNINTRDNICTVCRKVCRCEDNNCCICPWFNRVEPKYSSDGGCCLCKECYNHYDKSKKIIKIILEEQ